jgi:hypothetical protein
MYHETGPRTPFGGNRAALLCIALTPVYYVVPWSDLPSLRIPLGVPFLFLYAAVLPGFLITPRLGLGGRGADFLERAAFASLAGLAGFMAVAFVWALAGLSLGLLRLALPVVIVLLAATVLAGERMRGANGARRGGPARGMPRADTAGPDKASAGPPAAAPTAIPRRERIVLAVFSIFLVVIFAAVLRAGLPIAFTSDTLDHVAYVNEIADTQELFPTTSFYLDPGPNGADLRKGLLHVFYGLFSAYLGAPAIGVLAMMNAILAPLLLLAVYAAGGVLFGSRITAALSSLLFLIALDEGLRGTAARQSFYSHRFAIAYFVAALACGLRYMEKKDRALLAPAAFFSFAAVSVHIFFGVLLAFAALTVFVWKFCFPGAGFKDHFRRVLPVAAAFAAGVLPFGLYRYATAFPEPNDLHQEVQGVVFLTKSLYIADPYEAFRWFGPIGLFTFFALIAVWKDRGRHAVIGYTAASYLTLAAIVFNPVLLPPVRSAMTYLIARLNVLVPFYFAAAFFLVRFFSRENGDARRKPAAQIACAILLVAIAYALLPAAGRNGLSGEAIENGRKTSYLRWEDALGAVGRELPPGSVIASDPLTSYSVTAFTPHYTVCTFDQHAPPNDALLEERMKAARDILSPFVPIGRTSALLAEHRATHVIVNDRFPENVRIEYWSMNREMYPAIRGKFDAHPGAFEPVYDSGDFVVYRYKGDAAATDSVIETPFVADRLPEGYTAFAEPAGEAALDGYRLESDRLAAGGAAGLALAWSGTAAYPFRNYVVAVRFDHTNPELALGGKPFPKIARKIKEKLTGRSYRFSEFHKVRSGFLSPDSWPAGKIVLDDTTIRVPPNAAPGEYEVSVKLITMQHQPTYRLSDFFSDDDVYSGTVIARVTIR